MKKSIELSFINFLRQKKIIIFIIFLIPQLLSFGYYNTNKQNACYAEARLITSTTSKQGQNFFIYIINEFESQGRINYSKLKFPYLEFEGSNSQCIEDAKKAQKIIHNIDLTIRDEIQKELEEYEVLLREYKKSQIESNKILVAPRIPTLSRDLGIDPNFFLLSKKLGMEYPIILLADGVTVDKLKKIIFVWIVGGFVLSFLILLTIFFYNYLFRKI